MTATRLPYEPESVALRYWSARQELAAAARLLNEKLMSTDIPAETATALAALLRENAEILSSLPQVDGLVGMGRIENRGTIDTVSYTHLTLPTICSV